MSAVSLLLPRAHVFVAALLVAFAGTASAQRFDGGAQLHYELLGLHAVERDSAMPVAMTAPRDFVLAGARLHGFIGNRSFGYHVGLDLAAGGTVDAGGFAYEVALFPAGIAWRFAETSFVTLGVGVGASGATGSLDDAATFPLEARFELGRGIRVLGRARATFLAAADARQDGARFADELEGMLALRLGRAYTDWGFPTGNGYFVGASYREALGVQFVGVVIGYSIDMGTPRKRSRRAWDSCPKCE